MENFNTMVGKNIAKFRKFNKLTQSQLAEKLNFSDKSVSKWERGESLPELAVLKDMCDLFSITLNDLVAQEIEPAKITPKYTTRNRYVIASISAGGVWLLATIVFVALLLIKPEFDKSWLTFIYAIPCFFIVILIFASIWGKRWMIFVSISCLLWTLIVAICISVNNWLLLYIGIPLQIIELLCAFIKVPKVLKKEKNELKETNNIEKIQEKAQD